MGRSRQTKQRTIIGEEVRKFSTFFTAEEILARVHERDPKIGIATVYRYLNDAEGVERPHQYYCDRRKVYSFHSDNHCHFVCTICGRTSHFNLERLDFLRSGLKGRICHFQIDVHGVCDTCRSSIPSGQCGPI